MSEEQFISFLEKVKTDTNLEATLKAATTAEEAVAIAKDAGFMISADDWNAQSEISDEELEAGTGGTCDTTWLTGAWPRC